MEIRMRHTSGTTSNKNDIPKAKDNSAIKTPKSTKKKKKKKSIIPLAFFMILIGLLIMLYPILASQFNNYKQQSFAKDYNQTVKKLDPKEIKESFRKAAKYNRKLHAAPIVDPWLEQVKKRTPLYQEYLQQLTVSTPMATIKYPKLHINLPIYHGTDDHTLQIGVGHLFGTHLPTGGKGFHSALTAHTGLPTATLFDDLIRAKKGDYFYINILGETHKYKVFKIRKVDPDALDTLQVIPDQDIITLVTCTPYGLNTHRLLVTGTRVPMKVKEVVEPVDDGFTFVWTDWMTYLLLGIICGLAVLAYGIYVVLATKRRKKEEEQQATELKATASTDTDNAQEQEAGNAENTSTVAGDTQNTQSQVDDTPAQETQ